MGLRRQQRRNASLKRPAHAVSLDEMWTYLKARKGHRRNSQWVWTAVTQWSDGSRSVDFEVGDRTEATFLRLCDHLPIAQEYHSDAYEVYRWLPSDQHHVGKGGKVNRNEGVHSILRDRLYRLSRATKGYTKSLPMLTASVAMIILHMGWA